MNQEPAEITDEIFSYIDDFTKIKTLTLVCHRWNQIVKLSNNKFISENFEDFILNDRLCLYPIYFSTFNNWMCMMIYICEPASNLHKLIKKQYRNKILETETVMDWLAMNGFIKLIKYFLLQYGQFKERSDDDLAKAMLPATEYNQCETVKFIFENNNSWGYSPSYGDCVEDASLYGHLDIIKYSHSECKFSSEFVSKFIYNCNLDVIEYWFCNGFDVNTFSLSDIKNNKNMSNVFLLGFIDLLNKYSSNIKNNCETVCNFINGKFIEDVNNISEVYDVLFVLSLINNNINSIEYLWEYMLDKMQNFVQFSHCSNFNYLIKHSNIDNIKYFHQKYNLKINSDHLITSIKKNDVDILKYLFDNCSELDKYLDNPNRKYFRYDHFVNFDKSILRTTIYIRQTYPDNKICLDLELEYSKYAELASGIDTLDGLNNIFTDENIDEYMYWAVRYKNYLMVDYLYTRSVKKINN